MKLTKQQRVGMAVAALAVAVLGVDRFVLGGGGPASASAQAEEPVVQTVAIVQNTGARPTGPTLARRLERFAGEQEFDGSAVPNLFGEQEVWKVAAVFGSGSRGGVRMPESMLHVGEAGMIRVGQQFRGATLISVSRDGAIFRQPGGEFAVRLDHEAPGHDR